LDIKNDEKYCGNQHKQNAGDKSEIINFHETSAFNSLQPTTLGYHYRKAMIKALALLARGTGLSGCAGLFGIDTPQPKGVGILASTGESRKHGTKSRYFPRSQNRSASFFRDSPSLLRSN
jgi:hypothetical protein